MRRTLNLWEAGEIKTYPFIGVAIGIGVVVLLASLFFCIKHIRINRVQTMVNEFLNLGGKDPGIQPQQLVEEAEEQEHNTKEDPYDLKKPTEHELNKDMHDI